MLAMSWFLIPLFGICLRAFGLVVFATGCLDVGANFRLFSAGNDAVMFVVLATDFSGMILIL